MPLAVGPDDGDQRFAGGIVHGLLGGGDARALLDDAGEGLGFEAGAADERAVDVGLADELGDVVRCDAAAVEDAQRLGRGPRRKGQPPASG